jgi:predicted nuclease with TOPRIM domain
MSETNPETLIQVLGMLALAAITVVVGAKKLLKDWNTNSVETSVITLMHEELERMSKQNTVLSLELGKLQLEIVSLNRELHKLNLENQRLQTEVVALTREVARLQVVLHTGVTNGSSTS